LDFVNTQRNMTIGLGFTKERMRDEVKVITNNDQLRQIVQRSRVGLLTIASGVQRQCRHGGH